MKRFCSRNIVLLSGMLLFAGLIALPLTGSAGGGGTLSLQKTAPFETGLAVPDAVKKDCQLETKIPEFVESFANKTFDKINMVDRASASTPGKALSIIITDVSGAKGGVWSGPKYVAIKGTLWQDGKVVGTFTASRGTSGGAWGGYKGTCSLLGRCTKTLGKDVAGWLEKPTMGARLGDSR